MIAALKVLGFSISVICGGIIFECRRGTYPHFPMDRLRVHRDSQGEKYGTNK